MITLQIQGWTLRRIGAKFDMPHTRVWETLRGEDVEGEWADGQPRSEVPAKIILPSRVRPDKRTVGGQGRLLDPLSGRVLGPQGRLLDRVVLELDPSVITPAAPGVFNHWRERALQAQDERNRIENNAVNTVRAYYEGEARGYKVESVEADNKGWDLECLKNDKVILRVEVKGTKSANIRVELTPNEYKKSRAPGYRDSYRLAVVRNALAPKSNRKCAIYEKDGENWRRQAGEGGNDRGAPDSLTMERVDAAIVRERRDSDE